jgi:pre-mRNA-splicing factor CDC5/CEF1
VSSLLARKSAKQCKARWEEYLNPSLIRTEWSAADSEKLLTLVKMMPTSWRTIASIIGRSANQCIQQYQKLLDEAEQRESEELGLAGVSSGEAAAPTDELKKFRQEALPEAAPALPDSVDVSTHFFLNQLRRRYVY